MGVVLDHPYFQAAVSWQRRPQASSFWAEGRYTKKRSPRHSVVTAKTSVIYQFLKREESQNPCGAHGQ